MICSNKEENPVRKCTSSIWGETSWQVDTSSILVQSGSNQLPFLHFCKLALLSHPLPMSQFLHEGLRPQQRQDMDQTKIYTICCINYTLNTATEKMWQVNYLSGHQKTAGTKILPKTLLFLPFAGHKGEEILCSVTSFRSGFRWGSILTLNFVCPYKKNDTALTTELRCTCSPMPLTACHRVLLYDLTSAALHSFVVHLGTWVKCLLNI